MFYVRCIEGRRKIASILLGRISWKVLDILSKWTISLGFFGKSDPFRCTLWGHLTCPKDAAWQFFAVTAGQVPRFPWAKPRGLESNFMCKHQLAQEEAGEARWDLGRSDRLPVWWWFQKTELEHHHHPSPSAPGASPAGGGSSGSRPKRRRSAPSSGSWANCRKTQLNCVYFTIEYLCIFLLPCPRQS